MHFKEQMIQDWGSTGRHFQVQWLYDITYNVSLLPSSNCGLEVTKHACHTGPTMLAATALAYKHGIHGEKLHEEYAL